MCRVCSISEERGFRIFFADSSMLLGTEEDNGVRESMSDGGGNEGETLVSDALPLSEPNKTLHE
jgi:hypothetical protein